MRTFQERTTMPEPVRRIRKAVIPAAGFGTRFLPAAKGVPKEMMMVLDRPALHWIVQEAVSAGVDEVIIVTSPRKEAIRRYFEPDDRLGQVVRAPGKEREAEALLALDELARRIRFVVQEQQAGLAHALLCAEDAIGDEPFFLLLGDALVCGGEPCACQLRRVYEQVDGATVIGLQEVPRQRVTRYGVVAGQKVEDRLFRLSNVVEKPAACEAPSNLVIAGRYLVTPSVMEALRRQTPPPGSEIMLTDAFCAVMKQEPLYGYRYEGRRHDLGNPRDYFAAILDFAKRDAEYGKILEDEVRACREDAVELSTRCGTADAPVSRG